MHKWRILIVANNLKGEQNIVHASSNDFYSHVNFMHVKRKIRKNIKRNP